MWLTISCYHHLAEEAQVLLRQPSRRVKTPRGGILSPGDHRRPHAYLPGRLARFRGPLRRGSLAPARGRPGHRLPSLPGGHAQPLAHPARLRPGATARGHGQDGRGVPAPLTRPAHLLLLGARPRRGRVVPNAERRDRRAGGARSEEHTSELQSRRDLVCRLLLEKKKKSVSQPAHEKKKNK